MRVNHQIVVALFSLLLATPRGVVAAPLPQNTDEVVILAAQQVKLRRNTRHLFGEIVVNEAGGNLRASARFQASPDTQLVVDELEVRGRAPGGLDVYDVTANTILDPKGQLNILGTGPTPIQPFEFPIFAYPPVPAVTPGTDLCPSAKSTPTRCLIRRQDGPVTLSPGDYGFVIVRRRGVLILEGGTYNFERLRAGGNSAILFNSTATVNVLGRTRFGGRILVGPNPDVPAFSSRCVDFNVADDRTVRIGGASTFNALLSAPAARVKIGQSSFFRGTVTADTVIAGRNTLLEPPPAPNVCP